MWKKISEFIKQNQDIYNDFYSELSGFNETLNYMRHNRQKKKSSITKLIIGLILGIPALICGIVLGAHLVPLLILGSILGIGLTDSLHSIIKYYIAHRRSSDYASNAYDIKVIIDRSEKCFKKELIESLTEQDCTIQNLNDLKSRLIELEYAKDELKKKPQQRVTEMSIYNEIELTEFLLSSMNRLYPYANEDRESGVTKSKDKLFKNEYSNDQGNNLST